MIQVKSVIIEGMHSVDKRIYTFDKINYLHGRNGVGKSTALQAVQLAILGYIPGTDKRASAIFNHANNHTMAVTAKLFDSVANSEVVVRRIWTGTKTKVSSTVEITPENYCIESILSDLELPIFNFNKFVEMTANTLKDWFISFLPSVEGTINWEEKLREAVKTINVSDDTLIPELVETIQSFNLTGVDEVRKVNEYLKSLQTFKKSELQRLESTIQSLVYYDNCDSDIDASDLTSQIAALNAKKSLIIQYNGIKAQNASIQGDIDSFSLSAKYAEDDEEYISADNAAKAATDMLVKYAKDHTECRCKLDDINGKIAQLRNELSLIRQTINSGGVCPYTSSVCESIQSLISELKSREDEIGAELRTLASSQKEVLDMQSTIEQERTKCKCIIDEANSTMRKIENMYSRYNSLCSMIRPLPEIDEIVDVSEIDGEIIRLTELQAKVLANKQYNEVTDKITVEKFKVQQAIEAIKLWLTLTGPNGLQSTMMVEPFKRLEDKMNKFVNYFFTDSVSTEFYLSDKANSFSFGINRNDKYISFDLLSSGEKCMYTLALMVCLIDASDSPLKLIMIDDLLDHLDTDNINTLFKLLNDIPDIQFILAGVQNVSVDDGNIIEVM